MDLEKAKERYAKLKALAERGVGGEKETAYKMLNKLMTEFGSDLESLGEEKTDLCLFSYNGFFEERLLNQCIFKTLGENTSFYKVRGTRNKVAAYCTKAQQIEISLDYEFYKNAMYEDGEIFIKAFIMRNHIYPADGSADAPEGYKLSAKDKQAAFMSEMMERHVRSQMIESR